MSIDAAARDALAGLTADLGLGPPVGMTRLEGGRNNRVFRVATSSRPLLLKQYYRAAEDPRDRLAADFGFSRFAWQHGVRSIAEPLAAHPLFGIALYEFVEGRRLRPAEVTRERVLEALEFVVALNAHRRTADAYTLPFAAEACFSLADHLDTVEARIRRLERACVVRGNTASKIIARLTAAWERVRQRVAGHEDMGYLSHAERCLSPSDFGFHNAIAGTEQRLIFHDFEYAGWDDPAKLVCDFFSQLEVPVPAQWRDEFVARLFDALGLAPSHRQRVEVLLPVCRVKWCCIVLNELLPDAARRRRFAVPSPGRDDRRDGQLRRAAQLISEIERELDGVR